MTSSLINVCRPYLLIGFSLAALYVFSSSCTTNQKQLAAGPELSRVSKAQEPPQSYTVEQRIFEEYQRWKGTRHQLGGAGRDGIDCSGFVKAVYQNAFHINLPRTTRAQVRKGNPVSYDDLRPGDLVFFTPPNYPRHVGIFLNRSRFVHASKTNGVSISEIDAAYWRKYFWTARRILPAATRP